MSGGGRFKPRSVHLPAHTSPEGLTPDVYCSTVGGHLAPLAAWGGGGVEGVVLWHISYSDETLRHSLPQERIFFSFDPMALPYSN